MLERRSFEHKINFFHNGEKMNIAEMHIKVIDILSMGFKVEREKITDDANIYDDLGANSLDVSEMIMDIENAFHVEIPDSEVKKIKLVKDIYLYLEANAC